ncbi:DUF3040 domain-containing protein [Microbacterium sp. STN6]|uniref:DUF3040 domain-containing protein n=1 Tax=Microbacterium sp. STN6 TaxID=2995588 RepID=UPI002260C06E|nr:DUF3040 domain-containing protein [Microbacterium sp. STN6]MCX7521501.1 DUF3040 domain-containing protein [Microbacterium sp. STN6]
MPLSEHEQRLLDEMERSLYQNDADFVAKVGGGGHQRPAYRSIVLGVLVVVLGIATLITGVFIQVPVVGIIVGVVGFVLMFVGVLLAVAPGRKPRGSGAATGSGRASDNRGPAHAGFMDRLNERWEKRQDGEQ